MSEKARIPLVADLANRDATVTKDGMLQNFYEENTPLGPMIVKRPGQTSNIAIGACVAQGSTFFNNNNYFICSNVLYVNPPGTMLPLACPVTTTQFGVGAWAMGDPKTGFVWVTDGAVNPGVVRVYNPVTQTQVTSITPPAGAGATGGLALVPGTREIVISGGPIVGLTASHWSVNADTYAVTHTLTNGTGGTYFPYSPMLRTFSNNLFASYSSSAGGGNVQWSDSSWTTIGTNPYPQPAYVGGGFLSVINDSVWMTSGGSGLSVTAGVSSFTLTDFTFASTTRDSGYCYDTKRRVIWRLDSVNNNLHFIPVSGGSIGAATLKTTLAITPIAQRLCYDPYRDVIWATMSDSSLIAISPSTGAIVLSCPGKVNANTPGTNFGTSLFMLGSNTLIQCANQATNSLTYIPLP